ncbi:MAG: hypothetical protein WCK08_19720, partial [Betaproteobacteria bacterium]
LLALIGDPDYRDSSGELAIGSGLISTTSTILSATRGEGSRIIADAAGAAVSFALTGGDAIGADFAGGFSFNELTGGITAGVYRIAGYSSQFTTGIEALASQASGLLADEGNIASFAGGFAVSVNLESPLGAGLAAGGALGLAISRNTIADAIRAGMANLGGTQVKLGALDVSARNERLLSSQATGDSLTISSGSSAAAVDIAAADSLNAIEGDVDASVDLDATQTLELADGPFSLQASDLSQIDSFVLAVALAFADGNSAVPLAGGGAGSSNTISAAVTAQLRAGTVKSGSGAKPSDNSVSAATESTGGKARRKLASESGAGSLAIARGRTATPSGAASIGAAVVSNSISGDVAAELQADTVSLEGTLDVASNSGDQLDTTVAAASMAVGVSSASPAGAAVALSGAGASASNTLAVASHALIEAYTLADTQVDHAFSLSDALQVNSLQGGSITANVDSGSLAVSYAGSEAAVSLAPAIGVSLARNTLSADGLAALLGYSTVEVQGDITLSSSSSRTIDATSVAVAIGSAIGSEFSLGLAGGGADANNTIGGGSQSLLQADTITAEGDLTLVGQSDDTITAEVLAIAGAGQGNATGSGGAVSIGASVAHNRLGVDGDGPDADGDGVTIAASVNGSDGSSGVTSLTAQNLSATAQQSTSLTAAVAATAAAIGWEDSGKVGVSASGAGADATNTVKQNLNAAVIGAGDGATLTITGVDAGSPGLINLSADDTSTLSATATGAALAFNLAPNLSAAPAVGVSLADNTLIRNQLAQLQGFSVGDGGGGVHSSGDIQVQSTSSGSLDATSVAVAIAATLGSNSLGLSGGGAQSFNTVLGASQALIGDSDLGEESGTKASDVLVNAQDTGTINSQVDAIAASLAVGSDATASAAIGVALSRNFIGEKQNDSDLSGGDPIAYVNPVAAQDGATVEGNLLQAGILGSNLYLDGDL